MKQFLIMMSLLILSKSLFGQDAHTLISDAYSRLNLLESKQNPLNFDTDYQKALDLIQQYEHYPNDTKENTHIIYLMCKILVIYQLQYPEDFQKQQLIALDFVAQARTAWNQLINDRRTPEYIKQYYRLNGINQSVFEARENAIMHRSQCITNIRKLFSFKIKAYETLPDKDAITTTIQNMKQLYENIQTVNSSTLPMVFEAAKQWATKWETMEPQTQDLVNRTAFALQTYCSAWYQQEQFKTIGFFCNHDLNQIYQNLDKAMLHLAQVQTQTIATAAFIHQFYTQIGLDTQRIQSFKNNIRQNTFRLRRCPATLNTKQYVEVLRTTQKLAIDFAEFEKMAQVKELFLSNQPIKLLVTLPNNELTFKEILDFYQAEDRITRNIYFVNLKDLNRAFLGGIDAIPDIQESKSVSGRCLWLMNPAAMGIFKGTQYANGVPLSSLREILISVYYKFKNQ